MNCQNCGTQIPEGALVCPSCGTSAKQNNFEDEKVYDDQKSKAQKKKRTQGIEDVSDLFVNPNEQLLDIIGGGYLKNLILTGRLASGFGILTDSRFYFRGKCYHQSKWRLYKTKEESIVDLQDITASGFEFRRNLILAAIAGVVSLIALLLILAEVFFNHENFIEVLLVTLIGGSISAALWALYILYRRVIYQIYHAGGSLAIKASTYGIKQLHAFDKQLHQAKDERLKEQLL